MKTAAQIFVCAAVFLFLLPALAGCGRKESGAQDQEMADTGFDTEAEVLEKEELENVGGLTAPPEPGREVVDG